MLHYITRTALNQLIEAGKVHDCAEGYGSYVVALTTAKFGKGLGTILLVEWHDTEYWANRMASNFELENLHPGWDGAYEVEVWYVMEDEWYDVAPVWDPERPAGRIHMLTFLDGNDEEVGTAYRHNLYSAVKTAQNAVRYDREVVLVVINDFSTGRVIRVDRDLANVKRLYGKLVSSFRDVEEYCQALHQLREAAVI